MGAIFLFDGGIRFFSFCWYYGRVGAPCNLLLFHRANYTATALAIYSALVTGNVDTVTRLGVLKKSGNVHPLITVFGVLVGLKLFGFMGLIFGPLLITYLILLIKIYLNEFGVISKHQEANPGAN